MSIRPRTREDEGQVADDVGRNARLRETVTKLVGNAKFAPDRSDVSVHISVWLAELPHGSAPTRGPTALWDHLGAAPPSDIIAVSIYIPTPGWKKSTYEKALSGTLRDTHLFKAMQEAGYVPMSHTPDTAPTATGATSFFSQEWGVALLLFARQAVWAEFESSRTAVAHRSFDSSSASDQQNTARTAGVFASFPLRGVLCLIVAPLTLHRSASARGGGGGGNHHAHHNQHHTPCDLWALHSLLDAPSAPAAPNPFGICLPEGESPDRYHCLQSEAGVFALSKRQGFFAPPAAASALALFDLVFIAGGVAGADGGYANPEARRGSAQRGALPDFFEPTLVAEAGAVPAGTAHLDAGRVVVIHSGPSPSRTRVAELQPFRREGEMPLSAAGWGADGRLPSLPTVSTAGCRLSFKAWDLSRRAASELLNSLLSIATKMELRTWSRRWFLRYLDSDYEGLVSHDPVEPSFSLQEAPVESNGFRGSLDALGYGAAGGGAGCPVHLAGQGASRSVRFQQGVGE